MSNFTDYTHSRAIIFSHLEDMYHKEIIEIEESLVLLTGFDFHFVDGEPPQNLELMKNVFRNHIKTNHRNELIIFEDSNLWKDYLERLIKEMNGVIDYRYVFRFNEETFKKLLNEHEFQNNIEITYVSDEASKKPYPVAQIKIEDRVVSYCKGFMIGYNQVEIDVFTDENYRKQNLAFECSMKLIEHLTEIGKTPNWNAWRAKKASHNLAYKCGFEFEKEIPAYIWVSDFKSF